MTKFMSGSSIRHIKMAEDRMTKAVLGDKISN